MSSKRKSPPRYNKPIPENIKVVPVNINHERRFIIIDADTGETFDDAQGYGYKTAQKAHAAFGYKTRSKQQIAKAESEKKLVQNWLKKNKSDVEYIEAVAFDMLKCGEEITATNLEKHLPKEFVDRFRVRWA